jgi:hypothetical protein
MRIAAVAPALVFSISRKSVVVRSDGSLLRCVVQFGQVNKIYRTVIMPASQVHRGLFTPGTPLWNRNALNPILPVLSWVRSALFALGCPLCSLRVLLFGLGDNLKISLN